MKRGFLSLAILLASATMVFSQSLDLRVYGGINVIQLTSDNGVSFIDGTLHSKTISGRPGFQMGGAITFGERFYIQPGFQYDVLSTKVVNKNTVDGTEFTDEASLKAFSIPLNVGFRLINPEKEDVFNIRLFGGFNGTHILSVNHKTKSGLVDISSDDYSNFIMNANFGMGVDLFIFYIDYGYNLGLSPVHSGADKAKANAMYANFGLRIKI